MQMTFDNGKQLLRIYQWKSKKKKIIKKHFWRLFIIIIILFRVIVNYSERSHLLNIFFCDVYQIENVLCADLLPISQ